MILFLPLFHHATILTSLLNQFLGEYQNWTCPILRTRRNVNPAISLKDFHKGRYSSTFGRAVDAATVASVAGVSTFRSVVMMAEMPSAFRTGTERVIIQTSPRPASK